MLARSTHTLVIRLSAWGLLQAFVVVQIVVPTAWASPPDTLRAVQGAQAGLEEDVRATIGAAASAGLDEAAFRLSQNQILERLTPLLDRKPPMLTFLDVDGVTAARDRDISPETRQTIETFFASVPDPTVRMLFLTDVGLMRFVHRVVTHLTGDAQHRIVSLPLSGANLLDFSIPAKALGLVDKWIAHQGGKKAVLRLKEIHTRFDKQYVTKQSMQHGYEITMEGGKIRGLNIGFRPEFLDRLAREWTPRPGEASSPRPHPRDLAAASLRAYLRNHGRKAGVTENLLRTLRGSGRGSVTWVPYKGDALRRATREAGVDPSLTIYVDDDRENFKFPGVEQWPGVLISLDAYDPELPRDVIQIARPGELKPANGPEIARLVVQTVTAMHVLRQQNLWKPTLAHARQPGVLPVGIVLGAWEQLSQQGLVVASTPDDLARVPQPLANESPLWDAVGDKMLTAPITRAMRGVSEILVVVTPEAIDRGILTGLRNISPRLHIRVLARNHAHAQQVLAGLKRLSIHNWMVHNLQEDYEGQEGLAETSLANEADMRGMTLLMLRDLEQLSEPFGIPASVVQQSLQPLAEQSAALWAGAGLEELSDATLQQVAPLDDAVDVIHPPPGPVEFAGTPVLITLDDLPEVEAMLRQHARELQWSAGLEEPQTVEDAMQRWFRPAATRADEVALEQWLRRHGGPAIQEFMQVVADDRGIAVEQLGPYLIEPKRLEADQLAARVQEYAQLYPDVLMDEATGRTIAPEQSYESERLRLMAAVAIQRALGRQVIVEIGMGYVGIASSLVHANTIADPARVSPMPAGRRFRSAVRKKGMHPYFVVAFQRPSASFYKIPQARAGVVPLPIADPQAPRLLRQGLAQRTLFVTPLMEAVGAADWVLSETELRPLDRNPDDPLASRIDERTTLQLLARVAELVPSRDTLIVIISTVTPGFTARAAEVIGQQLVARGLLQTPGAARVAHAPTRLQPGATWTRWVEFQRLAAPATAAAAAPLTAYLETLYSDANRRHFNVTEPPPSGGAYILYTDPVAIEVEKDWENFWRNRLYELGVLLLQLGDELGLNAWELAQAIARARPVTHD